MIHRVVSYLIELSVTKDNNIKSVLKKAADDIQRDRE